MRRSRALDAVAAIERRLRAQARAAASHASDIAAKRRRNGAAFEQDLVEFNRPAAVRSACACSSAAARSILLSSVDAALRHDLSVADKSARLAHEAILPWAQLRRGLERRAARRSTKPPA